MDQQKHRNVDYCRFCLTKNDLMEISEEKQETIFSFLCLPVTHNHRLKLCINCNSIVLCLEKFKRNCMKADSIIQGGIESVLKNTFLSSVTDESVNLAFDTIQNWLGDISVILKYFAEVKTERNDFFTKEEIDSCESDNEMEVEALHEEDMFVMHVSEENIVLKMESHELEEAELKQESETTFLDADERENEYDELWLDCQEDMSKSFELENSNKKILTKKYKCEICGKSCNKTDLERHMNIHNGKTPYMCHIDGCERSFSAPRNLTIHLREIHYIKNGQKIELSSIKTVSDIIDRENKEINLEELFDPTKKGQKRPYKCETCQKHYCKSEMIYHQYAHLNIKPFECKHEDCGKTFSSPREVTRHEQKYHTTDNEESGNCVEKLVELEIIEQPNEGKLVGKMDSHILNDELLEKYFVEERRGFKRPYQCDICKRFYGKTEMRYHLNVHANLTPFKCVIENCSRLFRNPRDMRVHVKKVHHKYVKPAPTSFLNRRPSIKVSRTKNDDSKIYNQINIMCTICGREVRKKHFKEHLRTHDKPEIQCTQYEDCNEKFKTNAQLTAHIKNRHDVNYLPPIPSTDYICELCGKTFSKSRLSYHMNIHLGVAPFKCDLIGCTESFISPARLKQHKNVVHLQNKRYRCHYCPAKFDSKDDYAKHRLEECTTKTVECHICGKILSRFSLKNHLAVHSGIKSFVCPVEGCGKAFIRKDKLKQHSISHSNEKMFTCLICSQQFGYKQTLEKHIAKVHNNDKC